VISAVIVAEVIRQGVELEVTFSDFADEALVDGVQMKGMSLNRSMSHKVTKCFAVNFSGGDP
jgi:hypothetical protein